MSDTFSGSLAAVTLDDVLYGGTCGPISLKDFETFLTHKQHSVEYLRFVVWYRSYVSRFSSLSLELRNRSPPISAYDETDLDCKLPSPARLARFVSQASSSQSSHALFGTTSCSTTATLLSSAGSQPFRAECASVARSFLDSNAPSSMILNIPPELVDATLTYLSHTTHPSVFHPVYQLSCEMLQMSSLPFFLAEAAPNINREKQLYWWLYGAFKFLLGWAVTIGCLFIHKNESGKPVPVRQRAWRLWAVPFLSLGGMQMYSAYRGFCYEVWGRGAMQLRPWEPVAPPLEHSTGTPAVDGECCRTAHTVTQESSSLKNGDKECLGGIGQIDISLARYDDFDLNIDSPGPVVLSTSSVSPNTEKKSLPAIVTSGHRDHWSSPPASRTLVSSAPSPPVTPSLNALPLPELSTRVRISGPERVVTNLRVRAVHKKMMRDILIVGFVWGTLWMVVILCLPWGR
ncbi:hypothetical protein BDY19DRAFT_928321 [Irpex rosettiformis]|uniref:Uncharacterized protein n=1 Tax=Irpex rosettiformis TaxID=378272 RepID=A0ACB8UD47_9APHY|nr:hypothetical protein BDY19DRAFT_928321 [Irpex rosettiformis]